MERKKPMDLREVTRNLILLALGASFAAQAFAASVNGQVLGGGVHIARSTVTLWGASASAPKQLAQTKTDDNGRFEVSYTGSIANCSLYLVATGGVPEAKPGTANNPAIALMTVMGGNPPANVVINEMTTVASVWTNAQFLDDTTLRGPPLSLSIAAGNVPNFVDLETGGWGDTIQNSLNSGQTPTMANFATLADLLSGCVTRVKADACGSLFAAAAPPGGGLPTNTLNAALSIALYPWHEPGKIYDLLHQFYQVSPSNHMLAVPYMPYLNWAPSAWVLPISCRFADLAIKIPRATSPNTPMVTSASPVSERGSGVPCFSNATISGPDSIARPTATRDPKRMEIVSSQPNHRLTFFSLLIGPFIGEKEVVKTGHCPLWFVWAYSYAYYYFFLLGDGRFEIRFCPGACGSPFRGDSSFAFATSSSSRFFGTARTPRMISLKCWNSGVESNGAAFILSPVECGCVSRDSGAYGKEVSSSSLLSLSREFFVRHAPSYNLFHDGGETLRICRLAVVVAKRLFVKVAEQVERLDTDVCAVQAAFKRAPEILHRVGVDVAVHILDSMVNNSVLEVSLQTIVGQKFVTEDRGASLNALTNDALKLLLPASLNMVNYNLAATLDHSKYNFFAIRATTLDFLRTLSFVHIAGLAADESLIDFDFASELVKTHVLHRKTDAVKHEPCGLLSNAKIPMDFVGTDSVLAADQHPCGAEPLFERDRGILENGSGLESERGAWMLRVTLPYTLLGKIGKLLRAATRALYDAVRPAQCDHEIAAMFEVRKPDDCVSESVWRFHELKYALDSVECQVCYYPHKRLTS
jgi:hypothetical protein